MAGDMPDIDLDAPAMTKREALDEAFTHVVAIQAYCQTLDQIDREHIEAAFRLLQLVRKA